jgi:hypothetical protein
MVNNNTCTSNLGIEILGSQWGKEGELACTQEVQIFFFPPFWEGLGFAEFYCCSQWVLHMFPEFSMCSPPSSQASQHVSQVGNVFPTLFSMSSQHVPHHLLNDLNMFLKLAMCSSPCSQWVRNMFLKFSMCSSPSSQWSQHVSQVSNLFPTMFPMSSQHVPDSIFALNFILVSYI